MNFIFIYGPPAAGKLTVARELSRLISYKLYDNHAIISPLGELFSYTDPTLNAIRVPLGERIRLDIFGSAAKAGIHLIATCGRAGKKDFIFFRKVIDAVESNGGRVLFVRLAPGRDELFNRVSNSSRVGVKASTVERLKEILDENPELFDTFPDRPHISIDNTKLEARQVAHDIAVYYHL